MQLEIILLAAGKGKRMQSSLPKVLLPLGGQSMLHHCLTTLQKLKPALIHLVVGHKEEQVRQSVQAMKKVNLIRQKEQLGTGHAVAQALKKIPQDSLTMVIYADVPLVRAQTLKKLLGKARSGKAVWCIADLMDPYGYGRILRDERGNACRIVEERNCTSRQRVIKEANMGALAAPAGVLQKWLKRILAQPPDDAQKEYLLTDVMQLAYQEAYPIDTLKTDDESEFWGANDMLQLAKLERVLQARRVAELARKGVYLADPARVDILGSVQAAQNVKLGPNILFIGRVRLGEGVQIDSHCVINDCSIAAGTRVRDFCHLEASRIGKNCTLGPYARVRPQSQFEDEVGIGNFVETKKAHIGRGTKVHHLTYLGDTQIGTGVNIGAGTITCNYDGMRKHLTVIKDRAFIGSNTALVAPVTIGRDAVVGAGSVINRNVSDNSLAVERSSQREIKKPVILKRRKKKGPS